MERIRGFSGALMLAELTIRDYVLVREVRLDLGRGTTALTGETGAGKSLLVGALKLLLGDRADPRAVRAGAKAAYVEGCFRFDASLDALPDLDTAHRLEGEEPELIVAREVAASGRSRAWLQGRRVPLGRLREVVGSLMDLHGQYAHQSLLRIETHRDLVDAFGGLSGPRDAVAAAHTEAVKALGVLEELRARVDELGERRDLIAFQLDELNAAELVEGEEEVLERTASRLTHAEAIARSVGQAAELLAEGEPSVQELLGRAREELERGADFDPELGGAVELVVQAEGAVDEAVRVLASESIEQEDGSRLDDVQARLAMLAELRRKYRSDHVGLIERAEELSRALAELGSAGGDLAELEKAVEESRERLVARAAELSRCRSEVAARLAGAVESELKELGMGTSRFEVVVEPRSPDPDAQPCGPRGADRVEFRIAPNVGESAGPLAKIGSGGELSRVMLALKTVLSEADPVPLLVFDEIDSGIGGESALKVATRLEALGRAHQVLVVTHLASIAAAVDQQIKVSKSVDGRRTFTTVEPVAEEARVAEIARMLAGDDRADEARIHARRLLARAGGE